MSLAGRPWKVLQTDYVWPSTEPERLVLEAGGEPNSSPPPTVRSKPSLGWPVTPTPS